jgi:hypothetical protein
MRVCPSSLPDGSVTVPLMALRSTCAMPGIAQETDKIVETINTDGEMKERNLCNLASKVVYRVNDKARCSSSSQGAFDEFCFLNNSCAHQQSSCAGWLATRIGCFVLVFCGLCTQRTGAIFGLHYMVKSDLDETVLGEGDGVSLQLAAQGPHRSPFRVWCAVRLQRSMQSNLLEL